MLYFPPRSWCEHSLVVDRWVVGGGGDKLSAGKLSGWRNAFVSTGSRYPWLCNHYRSNLLPLLKSFRPLLLLIPRSCDFFRTAELVGSYFRAIVIDKTDADLVWNKLSCKTLSRLISGVLLFLGLLWLKWSNVGLRFRRSWVRLPLRACFLLNEAPWWGFSRGTYSKTRWPSYFLLLRRIWIVIHLKQWRPEQVSKERHHHHSPIKAEREQFWYRQIIFIKYL